MPALLVAGVRNRFARCHARYEPDAGWRQEAIPAAQVIHYDGHCLTINGNDTFIRSAEFHYFRTPPELWRDRFQKIKDAGFNTVDTYVPWNWHEREMPAGLDDFSKVDLSEFKAWLDMAQHEFGLYTMVRPGPFICAEWAGRWLPALAREVCSRHGRSFLAA